MTPGPTGPLAGEVGLVTGSTSGIGEAVCRTLADAGCQVVVHYLTSEQKAHDLAATLHSTAEPLVVRADVSDADEVAQMFRAIKEHCGDLTILVNNASYSSPDLWQADPLGIPLKEWQRCLDIDLTGCYLCCREAIPMMLRRGHGKIVNMSSSGALTGDVDTFAYGPSKVGVVTLARSLAKAYAPAVQVNTIAPGSIDTGWIERWGLTGAEIADLRAVRGMPKRVGSPQEVADLTAFLVSRQADYLTGQVMTIDGGTSL